MTSVHEPPPTSMTGELLDGRYRVGEPIGHGAMSDVYRATDERLERRELAVKVLRAGTADHERFAEETALLCSLDHPNLVRLHDAGEHRGVPYLVLNLVDGTLAERLAATGPLPPAEVARIGAEIASALDHLHARGIVHRDIKPSNILLRGDGSACLADLGAALSLDGPRLTATGLMIGTPLYLAPEQAGGQEVGPPADVYSLGLVLLEAASGRPAFTGTQPEVMAARLHRSPTVPTTVPGALGAPLQRMVALDPGLRPSAGEVQHELRGIAGADLPASPPDPAAQTAALAAPTMVLVDGVEPTAVEPEPPAYVLAAPRTRSGLTGWFAEDRSRAFWVGLAGLLLVALLVGLGSRGGDPRLTSDLGPATTIATTTTLAPTTTTIPPPTTVAVAPAPDPGAGCREGCGNGAGDQKPGKKKKG